MSHFSSIQCKITDKEALKEVLQSISSIKEVKENSYIRGYNKQAAHGDIVAVLNGSYDLGFQFKGGEYALAVADFGQGDCGGGDKSLSALWQEIVGKYGARIAEKAAASTRLGVKADVNVRVAM